MLNCDMMTLVEAITWQLGVHLFDHLGPPHTKSVD